MAIGIITGSGTHALPSFEDADTRERDTPWGAATVTAGRFAGVEVLHVSRHGEGHARLSNHVRFRANAWALQEAGVTAVVACTACGALDPTLDLGSLVIFDDLHFLSNRLPEGDLCTFFTAPGDPARGHWILAAPFAETVRRALIEGARAAGRPARETGCYGHVDGPRFNTVAEIRQLREAGVVAVSQTGGPETVLFGELEVPYALMGFATDYANGVMPAAATPVAELIRLMGESTEAFAAVLRAVVGALATERPGAPGTVYRFEQS
jgi:5'-methylthioadenosine phosphorylase